jgi:hypothetical protein
MGLAIVAARQGGQGDRGRQLREFGMSGCLGWNSTTEYSDPERWRRFSGTPRTVPDRATWSASGDA